MRIDDLRPTARVPLSVRERLGIPIPVDVRFGMEEPTGPQPGSYEYEISESDRAIVDAAIKDANNPEDLQREQLARAAIRAGLGAMPVYGPLLQLGGTLIMNWLGFGVRAELSSGLGAVTVTYTSGPSSSRSIVTQTVMAASVPQTPDSGGCYVSLKFDAAFTIDQWSIQDPNFSGGPSQYLANMPAIGLALFSDSGVEIAGLSTRSQQVVRDVFAGDPEPSYDAKWSGETNTVFLSNSAYARPFMVDNSDDGRSYFGPEAGVRCGAPFDFVTPFSDVEDIIPTGNLDPAGSDLTPAETQQLVDEIKNSPWNKEYGPPPGQEPAPVQPPAPVGPPHPRDPDWPCGRGPGDGPGDGPGGPGDGPGGPGSGPGGNFPGPPGGNLPGGPGAGNLPGVPDFPGGPGRVQIPGGPGPGRIEGPPFPCDDARYYPGAPVDVQVGEKTRRGRIGASDCQNGTIIPEFPPFGNETFTKPWCRKNILVVDAVKDLAAELGMQNATWAVDPDCRERWTGCFPKSSSKFDAMWALADMCGYDVFPPGEEIGPMKPLPVFHGPYHEARDFWGYSTQKDGLDIPSHVEVYKPNVQGRRGFSIVLPVVTPYNLGDSKFFSTAVGPGVSKNAATNMAFKFKRYFEIRAIAHDVVIPYNALIDKRHQIRLQYPSQGFTERSMVVSYEHEVDMESGAVTKLVVSELSRSTYPKRNDSFAAAWGGSLEAGMRIPRTVDNR